MAAQFNSYLQAVANAINRQNGEAVALASKRSPLLLAARPPLPAAHCLPCPLSAGPQLRELIALSNSGTQTAVMAAKQARAQPLLLACWVAVAGLAGLHPPSVFGGPCPQRVVAPS